MGLRILTLQEFSDLGGELDIMFSTAFGVLMTVQSISLDGNIRIAVDDESMSNFFAILDYANGCAQLINIQTYGSLFGIIDDLTDNMLTTLATVIVDLAHPQVQRDHDELGHWLINLGFTNIHRHTHQPVCGTVESAQTDNTVPCIIFSQGDSTEVKKSAARLTLSDDILDVAKLPYFMSKRTISKLRTLPFKYDNEVTARMIFNGNHIPATFGGASYNELELIESDLSQGDAATVRFPSAATINGHSHPLALITNNVFPADGVMWPSGTDMPTYITMLFRSSILFTFVWAVEGMYTISFDRRFSLFSEVIARGFSHDEAKWIFNQIHDQVESITSMLDQVKLREISDKYILGQYFHTRERIEVMIEKYLKIINALTMRSLLSNNETFAKFEEVVVNKYGSMFDDNIFDVPIFRVKFSTWGDMISEDQYLGTVDVPSSFSGMRALIDAHTLSSADLSLLPFFGAVKEVNGRAELKTVEDEFGPIIL